MSRNPDKEALFVVAMLNQQSERFERIAAPIVVLKLLLNCTNLDGNSREHFHERSTYARKCQLSGPPDGSLG
jgi:hypothetical protein